jgi:hypothetical protein
MIQRCSMAIAQVIKEINASAQAVWAELSPFDAIKPGGAIESVVYEGSGIGMIRRIGMGGGVIIERLDEHDAKALTFAYCIMNDDSPLPFANYKARVRIMATSDDTCTVEWTGEFDPRGNEDEAIRTATGIYAGGIKRAKEALGV